MYIHLRSGRDVDAMDKEVRSISPPGASYTSGDTRILNVRYKSLTHPKTNAFEYGTVDEKNGCLNNNLFSEMEIDSDTRSHNSE
ncbi:hypothetical protein EVAR_44542_1 [Eumeta japonica]|uniref:Uncharacterized protein n=1 Tax=Eumeta variegata TaxID=151549 RepID=A0A4C1X7U1_EUMVA|nr:hypothetical protein EVAR_44542_1 [Eumeta japonica]